MSTAAPAPPATPAAPQQRPGPEACPLCGSELAPEQEWCLRCGAAARTRLAAAPNWKMPFAAVAVVAALSLGVLAAALVELAGETGPPPPAITHTVTGPAAAALTPTAPVAPTATAPAATPGGGVAAPGQTTTPTAATTPTTPARAKTTAPAKTTPQARGKQLTPAQQRALERLNLSGKIGK